MSVTEIAVILLGLFVGYWVVSKLIGGKPEPKQTQQESQHQDQRSSSKSNTSNGHGEPSPTEWHEILDVSPYATMDEIRRSYKTLMSQYHPDKVASLGVELRNVAERRSKEITSAYRDAMRLRGVDV